MKRAILTLIGLLALGGLWWAFSPLLFDKEVNDQLNTSLQSKPEQSLVSETSAPTEAPSTLTEGPFPIIGTAGHPASGLLQLVRSPSETLVQYQNYHGTNGPDLFIYLAKDLEAKDYVALGRAKGNKGNIIYQVPEEVDIDDYRYVITWCRAFGVLFDYAEIR